MMDRVVKDFAHFMGDGKPAIIDEVERNQLPPQLHPEGVPHGQGCVWLSRKGAIKADEGHARAHPRFDGDGELRRRREGIRAVVQVQPPRRGSGCTDVTRHARTFTIEDLDKAMVGIEYKRSAAFLDEIPGAYKDIDVVMDDAKDLVEIRHTLRQIVNVKGN